MICVNARKKKIDIFSIWGYRFQKKVLGFFDFSCGLLLVASLYAYTPLHRCAKLRELPCKCS